MKLKREFYSGDTEAVTRDILGKILVHKTEEGILKGMEIMKRNRGIGDTGNLTNGPGKLTKAFGIDKSHNGLDLTKDDLLFMEDAPPEGEIVKSTRIGLSKGKSKMLRFYVRIMGLFRDERP